MEIGKEPASAFRTTERESSRLPLVTNAKRLTSIVTSDMPSVLKGRTSSYSTAVLNRIKIKFPEPSESCDEGKKNLKIATKNSLLRLVKLVYGRTLTVN